jgi:hypothetical protein
VNRYFSFPFEFHGFADQYVVKPEIPFSCSLLISCWQLFMLIGEILAAAGMEMQRNAASSSGMMGRNINEYVNNIIKHFNS